MNGARSWARHHRLAERIPPDTDRSIELNDDAIVLRQALRRLTEPEREVVVLRFYADLKVDDIAAEVGLPPGTVKSLLHRTLAKLNKELS